MSCQGWPVPSGLGFGQGAGVSPAALGGGGGVPCRAVPCHAVPCHAVQDAAAGVCSAVLAAGAICWYFPPQTLTRAFAARAGASWCLPGAGVVSPADVHGAVADGMETFQESQPQPFISSLKPH